MTLFETIGTMFRLYWKIIIPVIILNIIVDYLTVGIGIVLGFFVGPALIMTSNAILGKRVNIWKSIKEGASLGKLFQFTFASIVYILICYLIASGVAIALHKLLPSYSALYIYLFQEGLNIYIPIYIYLFLTPLWIFIPMIMVLEKKSLGKSIKKSLHILSADFGRIIQMDLFTLVLSVPVLLLVLVFYNYLKFTSEEILLMLFITITGLNTLPYVFVYYGYRARHENYSEELLAQELGYQPIEEMMTV